MIIIIAGNYKQYTTYLSQNHLAPESHRYVSGIEAIHGFRPNSCKGYRLVGTIYENIAAREMIELLESRGIHRIQE